MDKEDALEIISMIADGLDPYGEHDPSEDLPENNPITIRAICTALASLLSKYDKEELISKYKTRKLSDLTELVNGPLEIYLNKKEKDFIIKAFFNTNFKFNDAAELLGIRPEELENRIKVLDIGNDITMRAILADAETDYFKELEHFTIDKILMKIERNAIITALNKYHYNQNKAADKLKISFRSLRYRIEKLRIDPKGIQDTLDPWVETDYFKYSTDLSLDEFLEKIEKKLILMALKDCKNNKNRTAEKLGISFRSLRYRIDNLGIDG